MVDYMKMMKALSDINRVRIFLALETHPLCVCQLTSLLKLAASTTSKHIKILQQAKLIESVRKGKWVFYKLISETKNQNVNEIFILTKNGMKNTSIIKQDNERLEQIINEYCDVHHQIHG